MKNLDHSSAGSLFSIPLLGDEPYDQNNRIDQLTNNTESFHFLLFKKTDRLEGTKSRSTGAVCLPYRAYGARNSGTISI